MDNEILSATVRWSLSGGAMICELVFEGEPDQSVHLLAANSEFLHDHNVNGPHLYKALNEAVHGWLLELMAADGGEFIGSTEVGLSPEELIQQGMKKN